MQNWTFSKLGVVTAENSVDKAFFEGDRQWKISALFVPYAKGFSKIERKDNSFLLPKGMALDLGAVGKVA